MRGVAAGVARMGQEARGVTWRGIGQGEDRRQCQEAHGAGAGGKAGLRPRRAARARRFPGVYD